MKIKVELVNENNIQTCRYCFKKIDNNEVFTYSYWSSEKFVCHKECKVSGEREEAIECQTIDADCNDCKFFQRGKLIPLPERTQELIKQGKVANYTTQTFDGFCKKFDKETLAFPKKWSGHECFEHRRS